MKKAEKEKNILDLKHQKLLNYLNILIILIVSISATYILTNFENLRMNIVISLVLGVFLIVIFLIVLFETKLEKVKKDIRKLR